MLRYTDARFSGISLSEIEIRFWPVRREDKLVLVYRAAVNHHHGHVRDRCRCWRK
jgi:hypothetical protein